jgi:glycosyltransferase involved in cell wall biosynthesis
MAKMFPKKSTDFALESKFSVNGRVERRGASFTSQKVDIIIPYYGQYEKVAQLVSSLIYGTRSNLFRICLVDDCSPNEDFIRDGFDVIPNLKQIRMPEQIGFGGALLAGVKALAEEPETFPWLVFLHSDCRIEDSSWLLELGETMQRMKSQGVKLVSALTNNPVHPNPIFKANHQDIQDRTDAIVEDGYAPLYCALCHRELFSRIGGFIRSYPYGGYEDRELADRMRYYGLKQAVSGRSWVFHEGDATMQYLRRKKPEAAKIAEENVNLYQKDLLNLTAQA